MVTTRREAARDRKTSGYLGLESHFHADASCQTCQIENLQRDQWQLRDSCFHRLAVFSQLSHAEKNQEKRKMKKNLWDQGNRVFKVQNFNKKNRETKVTQSMMYFVSAQSIFTLQNTWFFLQFLISRSVIAKTIILVLVAIMLWGEPMPSSIYIYIFIYSSSIFG